MSIRVLVCGGRTFDNQKAVNKALNRIKDRIGVTCIIQGGARGADYLGKRWAHGQGIPVLEIEAQWQRYGRKAGPMRNAWMLDLCKPEAVVAFPGGPGTAHMIEAASAAHVWVREPLASDRDATPREREAVEGEASQPGPSGIAQPLPSGTTHD